MPAGKPIGAKESPSNSLIIRGLAIEVPAASVAGTSAVRVEYSRRHVDLESCDRMGLLLNYPYSGNAAVSICNYEILKTLCYYTGVLDVEQRR